MITFVSVIFPPHQNFRLACIAAVSFSFIQQASERRSAPGVSKKLGEVLIFRTHSRFRSLCEFFGKWLLRRLISSKLSQLKCVYLHTLTLQIQKVMFYVNIFGIIQDYFRIDMSLEINNSYLWIYFLVWDYCILDGNRTLYSNHNNYIYLHDHNRDGISLRVL